MTHPRAAELSALSTDIRELLLRRSERIQLPEALGDADEDTIWVATFRLGDEEHAIRLSALRAAVPLRMVTPVPRSSRVVIGVLQFQGTVITALSLASLLGSGWHVDPTILLVVDAGDGHTVALDCAQVPLATTLPTALLRQAAAAAPGPLVGVTVPGRGMVTVIDLRRLLEKQDWGDQSARA
jgi:purine-binding chemotaxis protein CheW